MPFLREPSFSRTVSRILRVDHAGEYGAIRIYAAQIFVAKRLHRAVVPFLVETMAHERRHAATLRELMWPRGADARRLRRRHDKAADLVFDLRRADAREKGDWSSLTNSLTNT